MSPGHRHLWDDVVQLLLCARRPGLGLDLDSILKNKRLVVVNRDDGQQVKFETSLRKAAAGYDTRFVVS